MPPSSSRGGYHFIAAAVTPETASRTLRRDPVLPTNAASSCSNYPLLSSPPTMSSARRSNDWSTPRAWPARCLPATVFRWRRPILSPNAHKRPIPM